MTHQSASPLSSYNLVLLLNFSQTLMSTYSPQDSSNHQHPTFNFSTSKALMFYTSKIIQYSLCSAFSFSVILPHLHLCYYKWLFPQIFHNGYANWYFHRKWIFLLIHIYVHIQHWSFVVFIMLSFFYLILFFLKPFEYNLCFPCVHQCGVIHWEMNYLLVIILPKKMRVR